MRTEIKKTADGSSTLFVPELNEHYHSTHGAVQESMHVFIKMGLQAITRSRINLLEVGFGTGLNAILSYMETGPFRSIEYHTIEKYPLLWRQIEPLGYPLHLKLDPDNAERFKRMHEVRWGQPNIISDHFSLTKQEVALQDLDPEQKYDLVYFDAFAPDIQPEMWTKNIFSMLYEAMNNGAVLVTYSAKGEVRRNMQRAGFSVERLPGPPGKREMLRATKQNQ